jgi:hypothetical protein
MPNMNRASARLFRDRFLERPRLPHAELIPVMQQEREDWLQFMGHAKRLVEFKRLRRQRLGLERPLCPCCTPFNPRHLPVVVEDDTGSFVRAAANSVLSRSEWS